jgi:uncharacterized protein (DUF4415 family)
MEKRERISRATDKEIQSMQQNGESRSDWAAAESMSAAEIERLADEDDGPLPEGWEDSVEMGLPQPAQPVNIRLDAGVLRWFKAAGPGYQTRINTVLRAFVQARQRTEK